MQKTAILIFFSTNGLIQILHLTDFKLPTISHMVFFQYLHMYSIFLIKHFIAYIVISLLKQFFFQMPSQCLQLFTHKSVICRIDIN